MADPDIYCPVPGRSDNSGPADVIWGRGQELVLMYLAGVEQVLPGWAGA